MGLHRLFFDNPHLFSIYFPFSLVISKNMHYNIYNTF